MRGIEILTLKEGQKLPRTIYDEAVDALHKGIIKSNYIKRLGELGIPCLLRMNWLDHRK